MIELVKLPVIFIIPLDTVFIPVPLKVISLKVVPRPAPHDIVCAVPPKVTAVELVDTTRLSPASVTSELVKLPLTVSVPDWVVFKPVPERVKLE